MLSQIRVDFRDNGKGLEPVIAIKLQDSEDPRDGLLKTFFHSLGGDSSWLSVSFDHHIINGEEDKITYISLYPVKPEELSSVAKTIGDRTSGKISQKSPINYSHIKNNQRKRKY